MPGSKKSFPLEWIILANSRWNAGGGGSSAQQYARALAKKRLRSLFVGPREIAKMQSFLARKSAVSKNTVALCSLPRRDFLNACQHLKEKGGRVIYRIVDSWEHFDCDAWYDREVERDFIRFADLCYASSQALADKFKPLRPDIRFLPNAADRAKFSQRPRLKPRDLKIGEVTVGFWGSLWTDWFDWPLLKYAARRRPGWVFNIIGGDPAGIRKKVTDIPANIVLIGQKAWRMLYRYLYYFDVCIVPYRLKPGSIEANPVKALEYLAGNKPIVSYLNESLRRIPHTYFYKDKEDFIKKIEAADNTAIDKSVINKFLRKNTWEYRLNTILADLKRFKRAR